MSRYGDNAARKVEFPAPQIPQQEEQSQLRALPEKRSRKSRKLAVPYGKYALMLAGVFAVLLCVVGSYMRLASLNTGNSKLRRQIEALESEENALNAKKEQLYNLAYVEDYAKNTLGMVKADKSQITYVEMGSGDRMVLAEAPAAGADRGGLIQRIVHSFNAVLEYLN